jgi:uncharacterized membrane protein HdeD (DUF308 family)
VAVVLIVRALIVIALGLSLLVTGHGRIVLGNLLATYWLVASIVTLVWARDHRGQPGSRGAWIGGIIGVIAALVGLTRLLLVRVVSVNAILTVLGIGAIAMGLLRLGGALRDDSGFARRRLRRTVLGVLDIGLGIIWIAATDVTGSLLTAVGVWGLLAGAIMLRDALELRRTHQLALALGPPP